MKKDTEIWISKKEMHLAIQNEQIQLHEGVKNRKFSAKLNAEYRKILLKPYIGVGRMMGTIYPVKGMQYFPHWNQADISKTPKILHTKVHYVPNSIEMHPFQSVKSPSE